jgi:hypothetical protein
VARFCYSCGGDADELDHWRRCDGQQGRIEAEEADEPEPRAATPPRAVARTTDPDTSHDAADSLDPATLTGIQVNVLVVLEGSGERGLPDVTLEDRYRASYGWAGGSTIRTRRRELVDLGLVEDTGVRVPIRSGRLSILWRVVRGNGNGHA